MCYIDVMWTWGRLDSPAKSNKQKRSYVGIGDLGAFANIERYFFTGILRRNVSHDATFIKRFDKGREGEITAWTNLAFVSTVSRVQTETFYSLPRNILYAIGKQWPFQFQIWTLRFSTKCIDHRTQLWLKQYISDDILQSKSIAIML